MSKSIERNSYPLLKKEITIFLVFLGILICAAGYFALTNLRNNPHPLWGLDRHLALGVPTLVIGGLFFILGVGFGVTSKKSLAVFGVVAGILLALFYFVFMISATGKPPINLASVVVLAIPILLWVRVSLFLKAASKE